MRENVLMKKNYLLIKTQNITFVSARHPMPVTPLNYKTIILYHIQITVLMIYINWFVIYK